MFVNPSYAAKLNASIHTAEDQVRETLEMMQGVPTAFWLDKRDRLGGTGLNSLEGILADAAKRSPPEVVTFIIYDLPNRDCHAKASNGEICCTYLADGRCDYSATGDCAAGLETYKREYIDPIVRAFRKYQGKVRITAVVEPDSLPNLVTNTGDPRCGNLATRTAYKEGVKYAVEAISASSVPVYLDAAHGGWLGWEKNMQDFVGIIKEMDIAKHLRGFSTNVANYQPLGTMCPTYDYCLDAANRQHACCRDPCALSSQYDPSVNELNYVLHMHKAMSEGIAGFAPKFVIDTGRNGVDDEREDCAHWCNVRGAGVGQLPTTETANPELIDAYQWLKTPGESDGCTETLPDDSKCPRFDADCGTVDSLGSMPGEPRAPEAGEWFDYQVKMLAENAKTS